MEPKTKRTTIPAVPPNSMTARVLLAFLATAGFFYVNIMPALVEGLRQGLGFSNRQAGLVGSCNVYGAACGAFFIAFLVRRIPPRFAAHLFLFGLILIDLLSMLARQPHLLMAMRFTHGFIGGMLVGLSFAMIARTVAPDRTFGMLLLVQVLAGSFGIMSLPLLVPKYGTSVLFVALILFSTTALVLLQFLPDYPVPAPGRLSENAGLEQRKRAPLLLALLSVFLFQAANMGLFAFIIGLGEHYGLQLTFVSETLGVANWFSMIGAALVILISTRYGILKPVMLGMLLSLVGTWALFHSDLKWVWIAANFGTGITWNFVISHLLGMCAKFDQTGQSAVWSGFASKMGLASGPMLASLIVGNGRYSALIVMALALLTAGILSSVLPAWDLDRAANTICRRKVPVTA
jgi:predicted MFS family arabinose efflux permease